MSDFENTLFDKIRGFQALVMPYIPKDHEMRPVINTLHRETTNHVVRVILELIPEITPEDVNNEGAWETSIAFKTEKLLNIDFYEMSEENRLKFIRYTKFFMTILSVLATQHSSSQNFPQ